MYLETGRCEINYFTVF